MRVKDGVSIEDQLRNQSELLNGQRKLGGKLLIICAIVLVVALFTGYYNGIAEIGSYGRGNPYNCESCKNLGRACSKHHNFDTEAALKDKIRKFVDRFPSEGLDSDGTYALYGYGNTYNTECDFCNNQSKECYACKYDREAIRQAYLEVADTDVFKSKLCDECWKDGVAKCDLCKEMIANLVFESIIK